MNGPLTRYFDIEHEDDLTRIVFGILELVGPQVLDNVLAVTDRSISENSRVVFHDRIDPRAERVPDVLIEDVETTVLIEAKRGANFDPIQIRDEYEELQRFGNEQKRLVLISGHESRPAQLDEMGLEDVRWLGWRDIALRISNYDRSNLTRTQTGLLDLLRTKLEEEGYVPFTGFSEQFLEELPRIWSLSNRYHSHIAKFHRDLEGRLSDQGLQAKNMWRDGVSQDFNRFPTELELVASHLWIAYGESDFGINNKHQHYLFVAFCMEAETTPIVRVGYSLSPKQNITNQDLLTNNADETVQFITKTGSHLLHTDLNFNIIERFTDEKEIESLLTEADTLQNLERVQIAIEYDSERLTDPSLPELIAEDLTELHEFTYPRLHP